MCQCRFLLPCPKHYTVHTLMLLSIFLKLSRMEQFLQHENIECRRAIHESVDYFRAPAPPPTMSMSVPADYLTATCDSVSHVLVEAGSLLVQAPHRRVHLASWRLKRVHILIQQRSRRCTT